MKKLLFTALLAAYGIIAHAAPYPSHDLSKLIQHNELNIQLVDNVLSDLENVAGNYPPRFDNDADQLRAIAEAGQLNRFLQGVIDVKAVTPKQTTQYVNILYRLARINAMAHNMDVPDAAPIADGYFEKIIAQLKSKPKEKARIQGEYGAFLVSSNRVNRAMQLLQQAIKGGDTNAHLPLGIAYLMQGNKTEAVKQLQIHQKHFPQDERSRAVLQAIEQGSFQIHRIKP